MSRAQQKSIKMLPMSGPRRGRPLADFLASHGSSPYTWAVKAQSPRACAVVATSTAAPQPLGGAGAPCVTAVSPLSTHMEEWTAVSASHWVIRTISRGYRLQFASVPPRFSGVVFSHAQGSSAHILQGEISSLLEKGAICIVPPDRSQSGFYSRYFLVPKRGGTGIRPILDLRALNRCLRKYRFKMLTLSSLLRLIHQNDWFTSIDLRDAYFHIPVYPPHRKFLRFAFQGVCYEYTVLPFGLSLSPRVFVRCTEAAIAPLRGRGIQLATYLDDWLLLARSREEAASNTLVVIRHLCGLGFRINWQKSALLPSQKITFLGLNLDSGAFTARLSTPRVDALSLCLARFRLHSSVRFALCLRLLGLMASAISVVPLGRLHMRDFQRWVASLGLSPVRHRARRVTVSAACVAALRCWRHPSLLAQGVPLGLVLVRKVVTTDASLSGWGELLEGRSVRGVWSRELWGTHINYLELLAVFLALRRFLPFLSGHHVLVRTDNTTTVAYINRQGGLRSMRLDTLARRLILWCSRHLLSIRATHVPGVLNRGADLLSRGTPLYGDWSLHPAVVEQIWIRFGTAVVDLFASKENAQCPLFFSLRDRDAPLGVDALAHDWPRGLLYAFPPVALIPSTLLRVRTQRHTLILVAPFWPAMHWVADIFQLLEGQPWKLPLRRDLVSQAGGSIFHPHPERLALWAWPLRGA
ncbi:putative LOC107375874-like protein, partial [Nothobranchius furzeri]